MCFKVFLPRINQRQRLKIVEIAVSNELIEILLRYTEFGLLAVENFPLGIQNQDHFFIRIDQADVRACLENVLVNIGPVGQMPARRLFFKS